MYQVTWRKRFVKGSLVGLSYDSKLSFASQDDASRFIDFLKDHESKPVSAIGGADYTCHSPKLETKCQHDAIKLTGKFETEVLECPCGFKIPF